MKTKTRWDAPHLEGLRWDYQLLHDCYRSKPKDTLHVMAFIAGFCLWVLGFLGIELLVMR